MHLCASTAHAHQSMEISIFVGDRMGNPMFVAWLQFPQFGEVAPQIFVMAHDSVPQVRSNLVRHRDDPYSRPETAPDDLIAIVHARLE